MTEVNAEQTTLYTTTAADFAGAIAYLQTLDAASNPYAQVAPLIAGDGSVSYEITVQMTSTVQLPL